MNLAIALTAARHGATIANHVGVTKLYKTAGKLSGARVKVSAARCSGSCDRGQGGTLTETWQC